jgi:hypothetical protein
MREYHLLPIIPKILIKLIQNLENEEVFELVEENGFDVVVVASVVLYYKLLLKNEIAEGISKFDAPDDYDPHEIEVRPMARLIGALGLLSMIGIINQINETELHNYLNRLSRAVVALHEENPFIPIFVFISVQDGLMHWLCDYEDVPFDYTKGGSPIYPAETKRDTLARIYRETRDETPGESTLVSTGEFIGNLKSFYKHRNAIMHGDPVAHFDMNIAIISLLFLDLTLYTVLEKMNGFGLIIDGFEDQVWEDIVSKLSAEINWGDLI